MFRSLGSVLCVVMMAAFVFGCGGNGGGTQTAMPDPTPPPMVTCPGGSTAPTMDECPPVGPTPEEMALQDAQEAAGAAYMAAKMAMDSAKDYVAMQNAQKYADMAKEANDAAQAATTSAMAEQYQMQAETARDQARDAAMTRSLGITKLANAIRNQSDINNAILEGTEPPDPVSNTVRVGEALAASATGNPVVVGTDLGGGDSFDNASISQTSPASIPNHRGSARVTYDDSGPMFTVGLPATTLLLADRVSRGETPTPLMTRGGWIGAELVGEHRRPPDSTTETDSTTYANVYTDIQPPTQAYAADSATTAFTVGTSVIVAGEVTGDGSNFAATLNVNPTDNLAPVMGQFRCITAPCSISVDDSGKITASAGYTFHLGDGITMQDPDYLAWGVWLRVPGAGPPPPPVVNTHAGAFASGNDPFEVRAALKGKATYNGVANGLYSAAGMVEQFDADVMLEANFGGTVGADSDLEAAGSPDTRLLGAVTGTVSNIKAGGMDVDGSLSLLRAPVVAGTQGETATSSGFTGKTDGILGGMTYRGQWGGQFYGPNKAAADSMAAQTEYPTTAAGTFGAAATNGASILGAFGSWKAE